MDNFVSYISIDHEVRFGKPCIKGTRIAITDILQWLASEMTPQDIIDDYPVLQDIYIRAKIRTSDLMPKHMIYSLYRMMKTF